MKDIRPAGEGPRLLARDRSTLVFGAITLVACAFAFIGLSAGGYWTDELFTLFVVGHQGGLGETLARALTDTQPPLYYFVLYGWTSMFGQSEIATRALSAVLCVAAVGVFLIGAPRGRSTAARLFATAAMATSPFWFEESQEARNYGLCLLISAILAILALRVRVANGRGEAVRAWEVAGLCLVGAIGAFTHFYAFLTVGVVYGYLILSVPQARLRLPLLATGAVILAAQVAFIHALLADTRQDLHSMWFRNDLGMFAAQLFVVFKDLCGPGTLIALLSLAWIMTRREPPGERPVTDTGAEDAAFGAAVVAGVTLSGIAVSLLFAPSFSGKNVMVASPFLWPALAAFFDAARRRVPLASAVGLVPAVALLAQTGFQFERYLPRTEPWRESAQRVLGYPGCAGQAVPVVLPARFSPPTPFFRELFRQDFYGRYFAGQSERLIAYRAAELTDDRLNPSLRQRLGPLAAKGSCPVLAWAIHDLLPSDARALADQLAVAVGAAPGAVTVLTVMSWRQVWGYVVPSPSAFIFLRR